MGMSSLSTPITNWFSSSFFCYFLTVLGTLSCFVRVRFVQLCIKSDCKRSGPIEHNFQHQIQFSNFSHSIFKAKFKIDWPSSHSQPTSHRPEYSFFIRLIWLNDWNTGISLYFASEMKGKWCRILFHSSSIPPLCTIYSKAISLISAQIDSHCCVVLY